MNKHIDTTEFITTANTFIRCDLWEMAHDGTYRVNVHIGNRTTSRYFATETEATTYINSLDR
jgi:hypothetical protein